MKIDNNFIDLIQKIYLKAQRRPCFQTIPSAISLKMKQEMILKRLQNPKSETGQTLKSLSFLPYTRFSVRENRHRPFLVGVTNEICYLDYNDDPRTLGQYLVAVPVSNISEGMLGEFHFVPLKDIRVENRHFHHYADYTETCNPLNYKPYTCWGSVGQLMVNAIDLVNITAIFEAAYVFLTHIDLEDILRSPDHSARTSLVKYAECLGITIEEAKKRAYL